MSFSQRRCLFRAGLRGCKVESFARLAWRPALYTDIHKNKKCQNPPLYGLLLKLGILHACSQRFGDFFSRNQAPRLCAVVVRTWLRAVMLCSRLGQSQLVVCSALHNVWPEVAERFLRGTDGLLDSANSSPSTYPRAYSCCLCDFWILQKVVRQHILGPIIVVHADLLQSGVG